MFRHLEIFLIDTHTAQLYKKFCHVLKLYSREIKSKRKIKFIWRNYKNITIKKT